MVAIWPTCTQLYVQRVCHRYLKLQKRNICNSSSERIVSLWKSYLKFELEQRSRFSVYESTFTDLGEVRMTHNGNQKNICRKCFYAFEKRHKFEEVCTIDCTLYTTKGCILMMHVILLLQTIITNIRDALNILNLSENCCGDGTQGDENNHIKPASSESVPGMPPCKKLFTAQTPVMVNLRSSPAVCVSDIHADMW